MSTNSRLDWWKKKHKMFKKMYIKFYFFSIRKKYKNNFNNF